MIDTHCHLTSHGLSDQVPQVVERAKAAGVDRMISVATCPVVAQQAIALARQLEGVYATVGVHPHQADHWQDQAKLQDAFVELYEQPQVKAFGELGLDWHYDQPLPDAQRRCFAAQLAVIASLDSTMPIIIHNREATDDTLAMLADCDLPGERFVFHCFTGSQAELEKILVFGAWVSFTGVITFKSNQALRDATDLVPLERLMVETDAPYLTPEPHRKVRPNEPRFVVEVARCLADQRGITLEAFEAKVDANAERFFSL